MPMSLEDWVWRADIVHGSIKDIIPHDNIYVFWLLMRKGVEPPTDFPPDDAFLSAGSRAYVPASHNIHFPQLPRELLGDADWELHDFMYCWPIPQNQISFKDLLMEPLERLWNLAPLTLTAKITADGETCDWLDVVRQIAVHGLHPLLSHNLCYQEPEDDRLPMNMPYFFLFLPPFFPRCKKVNDFLANLGALAYVDLAGTDLRKASVLALEGLKRLATRLAGQPSEDITRHEGIAASMCQSQQPKAPLPALDVDGQIEKRASEVPQGLGLVAPGSEGTADGTDPGDETAADAKDGVPSQAKERCRAEWDAMWDRAPFDMPELDKYRRMGLLDLATRIDEWERAVEKLAQALIKGDTEEFRVLASKYCLPEMSSYVRFAMEERGISCDAIIQLCELFGQAACGVHVEIKKGWLNEVTATTERLKTKLALELPPADSPKTKKTLCDGWLYPFLREAQEQRDANQINDFVLATPSDLLACCNRMIGCLAGFDTVFLMSPAMAEEQARGIDDRWLAGFKHTLEILCLAAVSRKIDLDPFKEFAKSAYSFWTGSVPAQGMAEAIRRLYQPCIAALFNLKRTLMVEIAQGKGQEVPGSEGADRADIGLPPLSDETDARRGSGAPDKQQTNDQPPPAKTPDPPIERNAGIPPYGRAIARVLKDAPKSWQRLCGENFSNAQKKALPLLVQTGLMEARVEARARMQGRPQAVRLLAIVSGNFRSKLLDEVLRAVPDWLTPDGAAADKCVFHFDFLEVRLTENGGLAKDGLADSSYPILWALMQGRVPHTSAAEVSDVVGIEKSDVEMMEAFDGQVSSFLQFAPYVPSAVSDSHVCSLAQGDSPSRIEEIIEEEDGQFMRQDETRFSDIQKEVYNAVTMGDLPRVLDVLESDLRYWGDTAKEHLLGLFHDYEIDGHHMFGPGILPFWLGRPIAGAREAFEMLEITKGEDCASVFARRLDPFFDERQRFAELCGSFAGMPEDGEYSRFSGDVCDERKELKKLAHTTADYVRLFRCQLRPEIAMAQEANPESECDLPSADGVGSTVAPSGQTALADDQPDKLGLVKNPSDTKAYQPAARIIASHWPIPPLGKERNRFKALWKILNRHPEIWRWQPTSGNIKLMVHLGRWLEFVQTEKDRLSKGLEAVAAKGHWMCRKCRHIFISPPDDASCPKCKSSDITPVIPRPGK